MQTSQHDESSISFRNLDWKWVWVGVCMFIVFHLLPVHILRHGLLPPGIFQGWALAIWGFGGIAIVGFVVGYLSRGYTVWEPGLSGVMYVLVILLVSRFAGGVIPEKATAHVGFLAIILGAVFVLGVGGALIGELGQARKLSMEVKDE